MQAKQEKRIRWILVGMAALLLLALFDGWPYGYFTLLRIAVCAGSAYLAWEAGEADKETWVWVFGAIAVLFNPIIPIHLTREIWWPIDLAAGIFFLISIFRFKPAKG